MGVLEKASFRNRCSGAPRDQGSIPHVSIVGWWYTRSGATAASHERLSDPVTCCWRKNSGGLAGGRFRRYWDRSNIPQSAQKANEMWNNRKLVLFWQSKVPLFAQSFIGFALFRRVECKCVAYKLGAGSIRASRISFSDHNAHGPRSLETNVVYVMHRPVDHVGNLLRSACMWGRYLY